MLTEQTCRTMYRFVLVLHWRFSFHFRDSAQPLPPPFLHHLLPQVMPTQNYTFTYYTRTQVQTVWVQHWHVRAPLPWQHQSWMPNGCNKKMIITECPWVHQTFDAIYLEDNYGSQPAIKQDSRVSTIAFKNYQHHYNHNGNTHRVLELGKGTTFR